MASLYMKMRARDQLAQRWLPEPGQVGEDRALPGGLPVQPCGAQPQPSRLMGESPALESEAKRWALLLLCCSLPFTVKGAEAVAGDAGAFIVTGVVFVAVYLLAWRAP